MTKRCFASGIVCDICVRFIHFHPRLLSCSAASHGVVAVVAGAGDEGSRTTRGEIHRRNEVMRKERESCEVQAITVIRCHQMSSGPSDII